MLILEADPNWWDIEREDATSVASRLSTMVTAIEGSLGERRFANVVYNRLATGRDLPNVYGLSMSRRNYQPFADSLSNYQPPAVNVCAMSVEALTAKVGKNRPWLVFSTTDADWRTGRRAVKLSRYIDGIFWKAKFWEVLQAAFRDMLTFADGVGVIKWFVEDKTIKCERVIPEEILVDPADAVHGRPQTLYQRTFAAKAALMKKYPAHAEKIAMASGAVAGLGWYGQNVPEQYAPVIDTWHLGTKDDPGRHVFMVGDSIIVDEPWIGGFPFSFIKGYPLGYGFFRQGIVEQLVPYQVKLEKLERVIDESQARFGPGKWFVQNGTGVDASMLVAKVASVVTYTPSAGGGGQPVRDIGQAASPEMYAERQTWIRLAFDRVGLSEDAVTGQKPAGLNSGEAQRVHSDLAGVRQSVLALAIESCVVEAGERVLDLARKLKPKITAPGRRGMRVIDWDDAALDPDGFFMKAFPISNLPATPEGKAQRANEMLQMGEITKDQYSRILGNFDVDHEASLATAPRDCIEAMLDGVVEDDDYEHNAPEKYLPLDLALQLGVSRWLRERSLGAPEEVLDNLSRWIDEVRDMQKPPAAPVLPTPMQAPGVQQIAAPDLMAGPVPVPQMAGPALAPATPMAA